MRVGVVAGHVIEPAGRPLARGAIAQDVAQVRLRRSDVAAGETAVARLDDHAPGAGREETRRRDRAMRESAAMRVRVDVAVAPQGAGGVADGLADHARGMADGFGAAVVANAAEPGFEVVVGHGALLQLRFAAIDM